MQPGANYVQVGLPCPQGMVADCDQLAMVDLGGTQINAALQPTAHWADGSVKWCMAKIALLDCRTSELELTLRLDSAPYTAKALVEVTEKPGGFIIQSGPAAFEFDKNRVFPSVTVNNIPVWIAGASYPLLTTTDNTPCDFTLKDITISEQSSVSCRVTIFGSYNTESGQELSARFMFDVLPDAQLSLVCELHNTQRAMHPGGIWDLGDSGSFRFNDFSIAIENQIDATPSLMAEPRSEPPDSELPDSNWIVATQPTVLFQASSGGEQWDCAVHKNADGHVSNQFCGYKVTASTETLLAGKRANPILAVATADNTFTVHTQKFWQNFPKSIDIGTKEIFLRLFPYHHRDAYEIQGGERKTHHMMFNFTTSTDQTAIANTITTPLATVDPTAYMEAGVFSYFHDTLQSKSYDDLITAARDEESGFYKKRERLDEFGWRNFGDIHADHEAAYHDSDKPYVSHYNNQYDAIFGFARQYALTGDTDWQDLLSDLARHVMDIDIYRTDKDRAEYNNGLFWHTDHYVEAHTGTHRTFSAGQLDKDGNPPAGGGPGPEHCYSSGLTFYYFMTGDEEAKRTVLGLGEWIQNYHEGTGSVLETAKRTLGEDTASFIKTCKGAKIFKYRYPMDRGTGNYIRTLLDCFELTNDSKHLQQVEMIIRNTAGPYDEIDARNLDDIEYNWWYIIFLQELIRYLDLKRTLDQRDSNFYYARSTLLYYAQWMVKNDGPFLESADRLLHPNATWIAQESRKIHVLYAAYKYALKNRSLFLERARFYRDYVTENLSESDTLHYTRIQILLLQNHGPAAFLDMDSLPYPGIREVNVSDKDGCFHTPSTHLKHIAGTWISCLSKFRISNELRWIKTRAS